MQKNKILKKRSVWTRLLVLLTLLGLVVVFSGMLSSPGSSEPIDKLASTNLSNELNDSSARPESYFNTFGPVVRMIAALLFVILCIYFGLFILKRMTGHQDRGLAGNDSLKVLQTTYLAPKRSVSLVKIANRSIIIGVTENQLSLLGELSEEETAEIEMSAETSREPDKFGRFLNSAIEKIKELKPVKQEAITST